MKMKRKGMALLMTLAIVIPVYATDDNIPYEFSLKTGYANSIYGGKGSSDG